MVDNLLQYRQQYMRPQTFLKAPQFENVSCAMQRVIVVWSVTRGSTVRKVFFLAVARKECWQKEVRCNHS